MKIINLEIKNNPVLGNLKLDFRNSKGQPANTIIMAGENGCGKSVILNILYEFSNFGLVPKKGNETRIFTLKISKQELSLLQSNPDTSNYFQNGIKDNKMIISFDFSLEANWRQIEPKFHDDKNKLSICPPNLFTQDTIKHIFRSIFSDIGIDYTPPDIRNITSKDTDQITNQSERTSSGLAREITQLLIDIETLDSSDYKKWTKKNIDLLRKGVVDPRKHMDKRMSRFMRAFSIMFAGKKQFLEIRNEKNIKKVYFQEGNNEMSIESLSSGEKQIVFRGGFLLKDQNILNEEFILIDEPEISLHPNWQLKILNFYKNLFRDNSNKQKSQIFIATHSPFIVHSTEVDDTVIVLEKAKNGMIKTKSKNEFFGWTSEIGIKKAFNVELIFDTLKPIIITEGKSDFHILTTAWNKLNPDVEMPFEIVPSGIETMVDERSGNAEQVRRSIELISNINRIGKAVIGLFDNDREGNEQFKGLNKKIFESHSNTKIIRKHKTKNIYGMILPIPTHRTTFITENDITQRYLQIEHFFEDSILLKEGIKGDSVLGTPVFKLKEKKKDAFSKAIKKYDRTKFIEFKKIFSEIQDLL